MNFFRKMLPYGLLVIACLAVYGRALRCGLTDLDDDNLIRIFSAGHFSPIDAFTHNAFMRPLGNDFYRPLQSVTFMIDSLCSGADPFAYHLTSVILHCLVVCCLLRLMLLLGCHRRLSFFAALVFAVHPLFVQAVAWIPGRGDLLLGLFGLLAFTTLVQYRLSGKHRYAVWHAAFFFCATMSKENALMLPPVFAAYLLLSDRQALTKRNITLIPAWIAAIVVYLLLRHTAIAGLPNGEMFGIRPFIGNLRAIPEMLAFLAVPWNIPVMPGFSLTATGVGLLAALGIAIALAVQRKLTRPPAVLGVLWYLSLTIPGLLYRHEFGSHAYDYLNHRSYLPMAGIFLVVVESVPAAWYTTRKRIFASVMVAIAAALSFLAWRQCGSFADPLAFYNQAVRTNGKSALALNNRATCRMERGDIRGGLLDCDKAIRLFPAYGAAYVNRGDVGFQLGDFTGAAIYYGIAIRLDSGNINAYDNRARTRDRLGDIRGVIADLSRAIAIDTSNADRFFHRGRFEAAAGDTDGALADYSRAIHRDARFAEAYGNRGALFAGKGDLVDAADDFQIAIDLDPRLFTVMFDLGCLKLRSGDTALACRLWQNADRLGYAPARGMLEKYCR
jgi:tetratricopeptide (TPR) repeat protein